MKPNYRANAINLIYYFVILGFIAFIAACGSNGDGASPTSVTKANAPQLTEPAKHGGGIGWGNDKCYLCHPIPELKDIHKFSPTLGTSFTKLSDSDTGVCLYCHGTNGLTNITADTYQCTVCHKNSSIVSSADMFDGSNMHDVNGDGTLNNADCIKCHSFSDMNGTMDVNVDLSKSTATYTDATDFCLTCHDGNGGFGITPPVLTYDTDTTNIFDSFVGVGSTTTEMQSTADIHGHGIGATPAFGEFRGSYSNNMVVPCLSCHKVHTSNNVYLITESGSTATLADADAKAASVSVTDNNFTQLCAVCHRSADGAPTDNGLQEVTHTSTSSSTCTNCHYHGAGHGTTSGLF